MAQITLTIPDAQLPRVIAALCATKMTIDGPTPPTGVNAKAILVEWVKQQVANHETQQAHNALPVVDVTTVVG